MSARGGRALLALAGLYGASAVASGAVGAHALKDRLGPDAWAVWQTASSYHLIHALALLVVALAVSRASGAAMTVAGWAFAAGVPLFSGSLYALALGGPGWLGPVTPLGGIALIAGWLAVLWAALGRNPST